MKLLQFYNTVWEVGKLLTGGKVAVIIPIRQPGKESPSSMNYRPIALTSHIGKITERIISESCITSSEGGVGMAEGAWTLL